MSETQSITLQGTFHGMTVDQFLASNGNAQGRVELVDGLVRTTPPSSATQAVIEGNLVYLIGAHIRAKGFENRLGFRAPVVPRMSARYNLRTPDLAVTRSVASIRTLFPEPLFIAEVLSPENERTIRESFWAYTTIPSVKEILILDSESICAETCRVGADGYWAPGPEVVQTGGTVRLETIGASWPIDDFYRGTYLAEPQKRD